MAPKIKRSPKKGAAAKAARRSKKPKTRTIDSHQAKVLRELGLSLDGFKVVDNAPRRKAPEVDRRTDERRGRVLQLWGKKDSNVARILLEEGFQIDSGEQPITKEKAEEWEARRRETMRRNVSNDRAWWRERWRERAKVPRSAEDSAGDAAVDREEYLAGLHTDLEEIDDLLVDSKTKTTAKAMLVGEKRQTRTAIAKAKGVDAAPAADAGDSAALNRPFFGMLVYTDDLHPDAQKKIDEWRKRSNQQAGD